jgi:hypothetical protein
MKNRSIVRYLFQINGLLALILCGHLDLTMAGPGLNNVSNPEWLKLDLAAQQNARLKTDLQWFFGGKAQRGWYLYTSLIGQLLGTEHQIESRQFAQALYRWQQAAGLIATGILDRETWMSMVSRFQMNRLKAGTPVSSEDLVQASISDFYDPERPAELRMIEKRTYAAYRRLIAAANAELAPLLKAGSGPANSADFGESGDKSSIPFLKIISAFRSPAYQAQLRRRSPHSGRAGLAVHSPHFTGCALDLYVGGDPVDTTDRNRQVQINTEVYKWLVRNAGRFGFSPYFYEPWHWEYRASLGEK